MLAHNTPLSHIYSHPVTMSKHRTHPNAGYKFRLAAGLNPPGAVRLGEWPAISGNSGSFSIPTTAPTSPPILATSSVPQRRSHNEDDHGEDDDKVEFISMKRPYVPFVTFPTAQTDDFHVESRANPLKKFSRSVERVSRSSTRCFATSTLFWSGECSMILNGKA